MPSRLILDFKKITSWHSGDTKKGTKVIEINSKDISLLINLTEDDFRAVADTFIRELEPESAKAIIDSLDIEGVFVS
jgi:hypothetical protein